jgi:heat shock protein HtpX
MFFQGGIGFRRGGDRKGGGAGVAILIAVALIVVAWVLSLVIRFALSRSRELLADAGSVELTKNPDAMISALRKIEGRGELAGATSAVMEMCLDNPREEFSDLFATHPPIEQRIAAIIKFAGGHDPGPLALPDQAGPAQAGPVPGYEQPAADGPWGASQVSDTPGQASGPGGQRPFLPGPAPLGDGNPAGHEPGPWGPHNRN